MKQQHKIRVRNVCAAAAVMCSFSAHAVYSCSSTTPDLNITYVQGTVQDLVGSISITCTRAVTDSASPTYQVGMTGIGGGVRQLIWQGSPGAATLNHAIYLDSARTTLWNNGGNKVSEVQYPMSFGTNLVTTVVMPFYLRVPSQTGKPGGTYIGAPFNVTLNFTGPGSPPSVSIGTINIAAVINPTCTITTSPGNIVINYASFGAAQTTSTTFASTCTNKTPYTMALDATSGTLLGLNYTLAIQNAAGTASVIGAVGTGAAQAFSIKATVAAGQSGACNAATCTASQPRTLTITY